MATVNKPKERSNDISDSSTLTFENEGYVAEQHEKKLIGKNIDTGDVITARKVGKQWKHLVNKRRISRHASIRNGDYLSKFYLEEDIDASSVMNDSSKNTDQLKLNKELISHFVKLARKDDSDDEVDLGFVDQLIKKGADVNCRDKHGQGLLHEAARAWHTDIVLFFLQYGADINMADKYNRTPLHVAAAVDYPEMVELLLENGADIAAVTKVENQTPLHFAARNDAVESTKILVKLGADIEAKDYKQRTPIFVAAELDRSETAKYLIEMNADVTVTDSSGQICMTHMITKMAPVARNALDQFHLKDRANRKQYFYLNLLEVPRADKGDKLSLAKTPLQVIVNYRQLDLIMHPVIMRLIDVKWKNFGKVIAFRTLLLNVIFVLIWTILGVATSWNQRHLYTFPGDGWRIFLLVVGCLMTAYEVFGEITEVISSRQKFLQWKTWRENEIRKDMQFCHPKWPEEKKYLEREMDTLDDMLPTYFQDFWNYFDWIVYFLILLVVILHIADVSLVTRQPPCCESDVLCINASVLICNSGFVNNASLSVWNNRFFVVTVICLWLRLMKFTRAFKFLGPFIVMLGKLSTDVLRFLYLYLEFYIPYACGFWMIFGNVTSISSMLTVDRMLFSLFRITLVDDYEYNEMQAYDIVMAYILIGTFLAISAVLCLNLFIALLSDTFQRVYDNANANAVMQQASLLLNFEDGLSKRRKKRFQRLLTEKCSPEALYYDDDLTVAQDADLKKVTIQIKEQMDELMDYVNKAEREKAISLELKEDDGVISDDDKKLNKPRRKTLDDDDISSPRGPKPKAKPAVSLHEVLGMATAAKKAKGGDVGGSDTGSNEVLKKVSHQLSDITSRIQKLQVSHTMQQQSFKRLKDDVKDIKNFLSVMNPGVQFEKRDDSNLFVQPPLSLGTVSEQLTRAPRLEKTSGIFGRLLGPTKSAKKTVSPQNEEITSLPHFVPPTPFHPSVSETNGPETVELSSFPSRESGDNDVEFAPIMTGPAVRIPDTTVKRAFDSTGGSDVKDSSLA